MAGRGRDAVLPAWMRQGGGCGQVRCQFRLGRLSSLLHKTCCNCRCRGSRGGSSRRTNFSAATVSSEWRAGSTVVCILCCSAGLQAPPAPVDMLGYLVVTAAPWRCRSWLSRGSSKGRGRNSGGTTCSLAGPPWPRPRSARSGTSSVWRWWCGLCRAAARRLPRCSRLGRTWPDAWRSTDDGGRGGKTRLDRTHSP